MVKGKQKTTVFFTPSVREKIEDTYRSDNCKSQSEFIEKAVEFYIGYLNTKNAGAFLPEVLSTILIGITDDFAQRMGRYLYKVRWKKICAITFWHQTPTWISGSMSLCVAGVCGR